MKRFLRSDTRRHLRLGKKRRKNQTWRAPRGRHSKIRRKRRNYPVVPQVGYKSPRSEVGLVKGLKPVLVYNAKDLQNVSKDSIVIIARVGAKNKMEIIKKANEMKLTIANLGGKK